MSSLHLPPTHTTGLGTLWAKARTATQSAPVVVIGASKTGLATTRFLLAQGIPCLLSDGASQANDTNPQSLVVNLAESGTGEANPLSLLAQESGTHAKALAQSNALVVMSPGIKPSSALVQQLIAQNCTLTSDVMLALDYIAANQLPIETIGITGTNGKTTTTLLTQHLLSQAGLNAIACGNVGTPVFEALLYDAQHKPNVLIVEASSYQLYYGNLAAPQGWPWCAAALTGFEADHLDWHGNLQAYADAKLTLFKQARSIISLKSCALHDALKHALQKRLPEGAFWQTFSADAYCGQQAAEHLTIALSPKDELKLPLAEFKLPGAHNLQNLAMAAFCAGVVLKQAGQTNEQIAQAFTRAMGLFNGVEHRLEPIELPAAVIRPSGKPALRVFNDSKSTTPGATITALNALQTVEAGSPLILLMGGRDKLTPLAELNQRLIELSKLRPVAVIAYGEAAERFMQELSPPQSSYTLTQSQDLFSATQSGLKLALTPSSIESAQNPGTPCPVLVLSPACASFDAFKNFEDRGTQFKAQIQAVLNQAQGKF
ncbi:MAG: UDP-N-acetylmuramoyl-L-alanine--D-glutamate ligase [Vampirovibrionales bacterium]|nr:UDP-N-acetylmuramoyl-L-alanine--D-glutamate ligase [Vampirovibrionales bacterium]